MPSASSNGSGPRYAPEDRSLPEPWKGLVDGSTGYLYYWNPVTNTTQYEKPVKEKLPGPPPLPPPLAKPASLSVSSSVHRGEAHDEDGRSRSHQNQGGRPSGSHSLQGSGDIGHGHGHNAHSSRTSARARGSSDAGGALSAEAYRRQHEITIVGDDVPPPYMTFESTGFPSEILKEVHRAGFATPTPIQAQSWPIALQSRDIVAIAKTGSGKTLGYLIPGFIHLKRLRNNPRMGPTVLLLAPTRELATQIQEEADKFGRSSKISCTCVYGGAPKGPQLRDLDRGVDVIVATPGRLNDILEMRRVNLRQVSYLVLDEADRMLDMGFEPQIRKIVKEIPHRRQTLMYTATWPKEVRKIAADLLVHPVHVNIGNVDELVANKAITQYVEVLKPIEKQRRLEQILRTQEPGSKVIIFCSTKRMCDQLTRSLTRQFGAAAIHGDKNQSERDRVLGQFRTGRSPILVATDVAARGLDIKDIRVVINYDFPTGVEDYVHRIGRTGRAGATGVSYTFFSDQDSKYARELVKVLEGAGQRVPAELRGMVSYGGYGGRSRRWGSGGRDRGRSNGVGHGDSGYGARGGRGLPLSGRSDGDRGVYRSDRNSFDRYDRDGGNNDRHDVDARGRQDSKAISKGSVRSLSRSVSPRTEASGRQLSKTISRGNTRSRSNSRSLSPRVEARGCQDAKAISGGRVRSRSESHSLSPRTEARGRQLSKTIFRGNARSRSNSCSLSPRVEARGRQDAKAISRGRVRSRSENHSLSPRTEARGRQLSKTISRGNTRPRTEARGRQLSKTISRGNTRSRSNSRSLSPRVETRGRQDAKAISRGRVRSQSESHSLSPSPKRARVGQGHSRSRSNNRGIDHGADRYGKPIAAHRQSLVPRTRESFSDNHSRDPPDRSPVPYSPQQRKSSSYDDGEIREDQRDPSPVPRQERPTTSPVQSRDDQLVRSPSPRKVRSLSHYIDNGRREGSRSPGHWHQKSPSYRNGVEGPLNKNQPARLAYDGEEEEEGMILPEEEEEMMHPDEDTISGK